jgi:hypothetical protein
MAESQEGLWMSAKERDRLKVLHEVRNWNMGRAEPYYRKLLALQEKDFGADNPRLCPTLEVLATVLTNLGHVDEAQQLCKRRQVLMMAMNQKRQ